MTKKIAILLSLLLLISVLAGCSGATDNGSTKTETTETENAAKDQEPITLRWFNFQRELTDLTSELAVAYMDQNPNVTIEVEMIGDGYFDVLKTRAASGDLPDIFSTRGFKGMELYSSYMMDLTNEPLVEDMVEEIKLGLTMDDKILGVPFQLSGWGIIYNKRIFRENNLEIPTTLSQLKEVTEKLKANGVIPFINQFKDSWMLGHFSGIGIANTENPLEYMKKIENKTENFVDSPEMQQSMDLFDFVLENGQDNPLEDDWNSSCAKMGQEEGAMMFEGVWVYDTIYAVNPAIELGMFAVPVSDNAEDTKINAGFNGLWHISNGTPYPEEAKKFLNWLVENEASKTIIKEAGLIPAYMGHEADTHPVGMDIVKYIQEKKMKTFGWLLAPDAYESEAGKLYQSYILEHTGHDQLLEDMTQLVQALTMN